MKGKTRAEYYSACNFVDQLRDNDYETYKSSIHYRIKCLPHMIELDWEQRSVVFHVYPDNCTDMMGACKEAERIMGTVMYVWVFDGGFCINRYGRVDDGWTCVHSARRPTVWGEQ